MLTFYDQDYKAITVKMSPPESITSMSKMTRKGEISKYKENM